MAGLDPAIHVLLLCSKDVDARHKAGHDEWMVRCLPLFHIQRLGARRLSGIERDLLHARLSLPQ
jgi:hypothetical protein